ncbi:hypothetical protein MY1884_005576 [Beauveria asiatica]
MKLFGLPMGFYEWWVCHQYVVWAELAGHSGLRMAATPPNLFNWLLRMFSAELIIEDHDLHHRQGWKTSANYGKQTRLWDRISGTCRERVECYNENVEWEIVVKMPIFRRYFWWRGMVGRIANSEALSIGQMWEG